MKSRVPRHACPRDDNGGHPPANQSLSTWSQFLAFREDPLRDADSVLLHLLPCEHSVYLVACQRCECRFDRRLGRSIKIQRGTAICILPTDLELILMIRD